jgi:hypothetical protein
MKKTLLFGWLVLLAFSGCNKPDYMSESSVLTLQTIELLKSHSEGFLLNSYEHNRGYHNRAVPQNYRFIVMVEILKMLKEHNEGYHNLRKKLIPEGYFPFKSNKRTALKTIVVLNDYLTNSNDSIFEHMVDELLKNHKKYGFKENGINIYVEKITREYKRLSSAGSAGDILTAHADMPLANYVLLAIENIEREKNRIIAETVNDFIGNIGSGFSHIMPVVYSVEPAEAVGDVFTAMISIGSYAPSLDPEYTIFIINETDTLRYLEESGGVKYQKVIEKKGKNILDIQYFVTNPITGDELTGRAPYTFYVHCPQ